MAESRKEKKPPTNVRMTIEDDILIIRCNLTERHGPSKNGRSITVATTHGFATIPGQGDMWLNLNLNSRA